MSAGSFSLSRRKVGQPLLWNFVHSQVYLHQAGEPSSFRLSGALFHYNLNGPSAASLVKTEVKHPKNNIVGMRSCHVQQWVYSQQQTAWCIWCLSSAGSRHITRCMELSGVLQTWWREKQLSPGTVGCHSNSIYLAGKASLNLSFTYGPLRIIALYLWWDHGVEIDCLLNWLSSGFT